MRELQHKKLDQTTFIYNLRMRKVILSMDMKGKIDRVDN